MREGAAAVKDSDLETVWGVFNVPEEENISTRGRCYLLLAPAPCNAQEEGDSVHFMAATSS